MPNKPTDALLALAERYVDDRGGHESKCCLHRLGYGCNCRVAEWREPFFAGYEAAFRTLASQGAE